MKMKKWALLLNFYVFLCQTNIKYTENISLFDAGRQKRGEGILALNLYTSLFIC